MNRRTKATAALALVALSIGLVVWTTSAQSAPPALGVADAKYQSSTLAGREVTVRGNVVEGSIVTDGPRVLTFSIADQREQLAVLFNQTPPDNFGAKEVVVKGIITQHGDAPVLQATSIQVGCASKY